MTDLGRYAVINQIHADTDQYVPMKKGDLRNQSTVSTDATKIIYHAPYARKQYHTQFTRYTTPGTGPYWDKKAKSLHFKSWLQVAANAMK